MESSEQVASDLSIRIQNLLVQMNEGLEGSDLKDEMASLKVSLMENPAACLLIKNEDIGVLVQAYRKITGNAIASASAKKTTTKTPKAASKKLTQEELLSALDDPDF